MSKRADDLAKELDVTRSRMVKTVADINNFLSPMAILARNAEKLSKIFGGSSQSDKAPDLSAAKTSNLNETLSQVVGVITSVVRKSKDSATSSDETLDKP